MLYNTSNLLPFIIHMYTYAVHIHINEKPNVWLYYYINWLTMSSTGFTLTYMQLFMLLPWTILTHDMEYIHAC